MVFTKRLPKVFCIYRILPYKRPPPIKRPPFLFKIASYREIKETFLGEMNSNKQ